MTSAYKHSRSVVVNRILDERERFAVDAVRQRELSDPLLRVTTTGSGH